MTAKIEDVFLYDMLNDLGTGYHKCKAKYWFLNWIPFIGWIQITKENDYMCCNWLNGKNSHDIISILQMPFFVDVLPKDSKKLAFKAILSVHNIYDEKEIEYYYKLMKEKVYRIWRTKHGTG